MELQVEVLFEADARGHLLRANAPGAEPPPRFFLGRTRHGHLWRFASGVPERTAAELARLAGAERAGWPLERPPERLAALRARLEADAPIERVYHGPAFRFPERGGEPDGEGAVLLTAERAALLGDELPELRASLAERQPCVAVLREGRAVAACWVAARSARGAEAGVATLPGYRGRGLASLAAAAWARRVRRLGLHPLYSTEWSNRSSRGVAARLGLILYGVDLHLR
jgi:hypothetical protein